MGRNFSRFMYGWCNAGRKLRIKSLRSGKIMPTIVVTGPSRTGKTEWVQSLIGAEPRGEYAPTIGAEIHQIIHNGVEHILRDVGGQNDFSDMFYIGADAFIVFFDGTLRGLKRLIPYLRDIRRYIRGRGHIVLVTTGPLPIGPFPINIPMLSLRDDQTDPIDLIV